jgi:PIN domain nuclease of toxin-antitoxin system
LARPLTDQIAGRHHADPFDRVFVAQAQILEILIATVDDKIAA